jgi:DivIVA domain-containing protein
MATLGRMEEPRVNPDATAEAPAVDPGYALAERVRTAAFKQARRGYDRRQVDEFLARLADDLRSAELGPVAPGDGDPDAMRRELERVGESTASILRAAEQTARELRGGAKRDAEELRRTAAAEAERLASEAEEAATSLREAADEEARRMRLEASAKAEEATRAAEDRAESLVADSVQRRRLLEARIERLLERREALVEEVERLAGELQELASAERDEELLSSRGADEVEEEPELDLGEEDADADIVDEPGEPVDEELDISGQQTQEFAASEESSDGEPTDEHRR